MYSINIFIIALMVVSPSLTHPLDENNKEYEHCHKPCPSIYLPVCGYDGFSHKLFASDCVMDVENCVLQVQRAHVFMQTAKHMCDEPKSVECNQACTMEYDPVCGYDGEKYKTFGNKCQLDVQNCLSGNNWSIIKRTECPTDPIPEPQMKSECLKICNLDYSPVCATDGVTDHTYGNICEFEIANCESDNHLRMTRTGEC